ncbi:MAG: benzoyl-CoA-dihydrodiol lyase [Deltaproteobacteria bacterium]|jgi:benzoyl-CoA-dihydrodiol lyase|nr:benzoyl-CoA-dihydrodiol lyase [Deltaproteobacteria bacterium]MBT6432095.1 benzoyl-CoA-dihydrodiol lyase [Deltaproteobacteria bacterium]MBT6491824.1 benzoyl-CoA-dihydrodiol lyase [Deltaproteobacteria bacterium]
MCADVSQTKPDPIQFETHPSRYKHLNLRVEGPVATLGIDIKENEGMKPGYVLKLNSYDLSVDIELADAIQRLRFEHPEVKCVIVQSDQEGIFSSGANIFMLGASTHAFKVNFCKYTNETRLSMEDATEFSDQHYLAALNGTCSGGGYELALACEEIILVDDRRSAVSLPEVPYLGVLPGTGGLTRVVDKRKIRRDRADVFCTLAEGMKGKRAKKWGFVDDVVPMSRFSEAVTKRAQEIAGEGHTGRTGIELHALEPNITDDGISYKHVNLTIDDAARTATLVITGPDEVSALPDGDASVDCNWYPIRMHRELDDALVRLRFNHPNIGLVIVKTQGDTAKVLELDAQLLANQDKWYVKETLLLMKRVLKRMDLTAKSFFALIEEGSCFSGSFLEFALAADRTYMLDEDGVTIQMSDLNMGTFPMGNGLSRLETRLIGETELFNEIKGNREAMGGMDAEDAGLITLAYDELDWDDEIRLALEERAGLSPDALTGMEASLRFAGPETLETKIFGRLSAWQNWIFQRPNAVGPQGALTLYGSPETAEFDYNRT